MISLCRLFVTGMCRRWYFETWWRQSDTSAVAWQTDGWFVYSSASRCCQRGRHRDCTEDVDVRRRTAVGAALIGGRSPAPWQLETATKEATSGLTCSSFPAAILAMAPAAAAAAAVWQMKNVKVSCRRRHLSVLLLCNCKCFCSNWPHPPRVWRLRLSSCLCYC